jgi:hypothetical protein
MTPQEANEAYYSQLRGMANDTHRLDMLYGHACRNPWNVVGMAYEKPEAVRVVDPPPAPPRPTWWQKALAHFDLIMGINQAPKETR